mgnify:CR=1 FL=1
MDKDTPNLDAKGVVQSGVSEEVQTNFVADQLQRAHDERAGRPPSVENLAHESGNDESSPSPEPSEVSLRRILEDAGVRDVKVVFARGWDAAPIVLICTPTPGNQRATI